MSQTSQQPFRLVPSALSRPALSTSAERAVEPSPEPAYVTPFGPVPFTPAEAGRAGVTREGLRLLVATRAEHRVLFGVYVDAAVVVDSLEVRAA